MAYQLKKKDLRGTFEDSATIVAARNPNPAVLEALLKHYFTHLESVPTGRVDRTLETWSPNANSMGAIYGTYESPLTAAIRADIPENVRALLAAGADPTGITLHDLSDYAVRFLRGRDAKTDMSSFALCPPRKQILAVAEAKGIAQQTQPLTQAELDERSKGFPRFWTEPNVPGQRLRLSKALTALEVAAGLGYENFFSLVRDAGADESAWLSTSEASQVDFDNTKPSFISTSSPVHEAIKAGQPEMLHKLLHVYRYSPNYRPLATPTAALPPLSFALLRCDPHNPNIWACIVHLLQHPDLDQHLRSPIFDIHPLHLAVARHDPDLLSRLPISLSTAGTTALGHSLLHIACLPLTSEYIDKENPDSVQSIHCARTLDSCWLPHAFPSPMHLDPNGRPGFTRSFPGQYIAPTIPLTSLEQEAQLNTLHLLVRVVGVDVHAQDIDGNTALHYLAATVNVDPRALQLLRDMEGGEEAYNNSRNRAGLTPRLLWESSKA
ncbi:hypothetical protein N7471_002869 [Penicillium samsonianum]|uniref:uncharacterized protein n=1 Tax=Penicillium samsonianum TaxID=1882272 RepID=UPI002546EE39|nr:uncharacterized protein N7471_002869 [Penicillium samsonianum]KAJ6143416.1 hypothetical protein N7471_002869 [Penicillium samsonianum]